MDREAASNLAPQSCMIPLALQDMEWPSLCLSGVAVGGEEVESEGQLDDGKG